MKLRIGDIARFAEIAGCTLLLISFLFFTGGLLIRSEDWCFGGLLAFFAVWSLMGFAYDVQDSKVGDGRSSMAKSLRARAW